MSTEIRRLLASGFGQMRHEPTYCAYQGQATYLSAAVGGHLLADIAWTYQDPLHDAVQVRGLIAFFDERIDVVLDGERLERPITPWSAGPGA